MKFTNTTLLVVPSFYLFFTTFFTAFASPIYGRGLFPRQLLPCGVAYYNQSAYTCTNGTFLCPVLGDTPTLQCGDACYLPSMYGCANGSLFQVPQNTTITSSNSTSNSTYTRWSLKYFY